MGSARGSFIRCHAPALRRLVCRTDVYLSSKFRALTFSLSTLSRSWSAHFSGVTSVSVCYFSLFLGIIKQNFSVFLMHWRWWALRGGRAPGAGGGGRPRLTSLLKNSRGTSRAHTWLGPSLERHGSSPFHLSGAPLSLPAGRAERARELPDRGGGGARGRQPSWLLSRRVRSLPQTVESVELTE